MDGVLAMVRAYLLCGTLKKQKPRRLDGVFAEALFVEARLTVTQLPK